MELISVIVAIYNTEQYLKKCIDSLVHQSYPNLEIILVNDGSTDGSGDICDEYSRLYSNIKVIHKKDGGASETRNYGLDAAKGDYIAFVDGDDYTHYEMYSLLYSIISTKDVDYVECEYKRVVNDETILPLSKYSVGMADPESVLTNMIYWKRHYSVIWNKLYRRSLIENLRFTVGVIYEDEIYITSIISRMKRMAYTTAPLYYYRNAPTSMMNRPFSKEKINAFYAHLDRYEMIKRQYPDLASLYVKVLVYIWLEYINKISASPNIDDKVQAGLKITYSLLQYYDDIEACPDIEKSWKNWVNDAKNDFYAFFNSKDYVRFTHGRDYNEFLR